MFSKGRIILAGAMAAAGCLLAACGGIRPDQHPNGEQHRGYGY
jgi:hypothetical protein